MRKGDAVLAPEKGGWRERREEQNRRIGATRRAEREALFARDDPRVEGVQPASDELVSALATACNARVARLDERDEHETHRNPISD